MKQRIIAFCLLLAAPLLAREDDSTLEFYVGWSWMPFGHYYEAPYRYENTDPGGHHWTFSGLSSLLGGAAPYDYPRYDYTRFSPFFYRGFEYGTRLRLVDGRELPVPADTLLPPLPGSAPLDLRDPQREAAWTREINAFLGSLEPPEAPAPAVIHAPAQGKTTDPHE
jgi:hypothetical protein